MCMDCMYSEQQWGVDHRPMDSDESDERYLTGREEGEGEDFEFG